MIVPAMILAVGALHADRTLASGAIPNGAPFDGTVIETVAAHRFAAGDGGDLRPSERGTIRLWIPREHPAAANAKLHWLTPGLDGRHPFLDGRYRFDVYRDLLIEWFAATNAVEGETVGEVAVRMLEGIGPETTFDEAAARIRERARALPDDEREELDLSLGDLEPWGVGVPVSEAISNGTLETLVGSALHHGRVLARIEVGGMIVRERALGTDPVFDRAFQEAGIALRRRRARMRQVIKHKIEYHRNNPTDEAIRESRVALVPISLVNARHPDWSDEERHHLGIDYALRIEEPVTIREFYRIDSALIAIATLDRRLFGGDHLALDCPPAGREREQWLLRVYLADTACRLLDRLHAAFGAGFFADRLRWEATPDAYAAFRAAIDARRVAVETALRACPSLSTDALDTPAGSADSDLDTLVSWMSGSFSSAEQAAADSSYIDVRLEMTPIWPNREDGRWLYVEQAVTAHLDRPYRQRLYRMRATDGGYESEVFMLPAPEAFVGAWHEPDRLSVLDPDSLVERAGCAVYLRWTGSYFEGGTERDGCESTLNGASYATSEVRVFEDHIQTWDRGFAATGEQVWGAKKGGYVFRKLRRPNDP